MTFSPQGRLRAPVAVRFEQASIEFICREIVLVLNLNDIGRTIAHQPWSNITMDVKIARDPGDIERYASTIT